MNRTITLLLSLFFAACSTRAVVQKGNLLAPTPLELVEVETNNLPEDQREGMFSLLKAIYEQTIQNTKPIFGKTAFDLNRTNASGTTSVKIETVAAIYPESVLAEYNGRTDLETQLEQKSGEIGFEWNQSDEKHRVELTSVIVFVLDANACSSVDAGYILVAVVPLRVKYSGRENTQCGGAS